MKTLLVTGGTGALGEVVVNRLSADYRCVLVKADLTEETATARGIEEAVARAGRPYGLVHLVGGFTTDSDAAAWSKMMALNVMTAAMSTRAAVPHLEDGGRIIAIGALASVTKPAGLAPYVVSKSALNALIEVLAIELRERKITVNAILPGTMDDRLRAHVAETVAFLLSDAAASITGSLIPIA